MTFRTMTWVGAFALMALIAPDLGASNAWAKDPIGQIKTLSGDVSILRDGETLSAQAGGDIFQNDTVETGPKSSVGMTFIDNATLSLGAQSMLLIDDFIYDPAKSHMSFDARLTRGLMSLISGDIVKASPDSAVVHTPTATIGIRGTRFVVRAEAAR